MTDYSKYTYINTDDINRALKDHAIKFAEWLVNNSNIHPLDKHYWNKQTIEQSYENFIGTEPKEKE